MQPRLKRAFEEINITNPEKLVDDTLANIETIEKALQGEQVIAKAVVNTTKLFQLAGVKETLRNLR